MTITRTQGNSLAAAALAATLTITPGWTGTSGRLLVTGCIGRLTSAAPTVTTSGWTKAASFINTTNIPSCAIYYKISDGTETSVAWDFGGNATTGKIVWMGEYSSDQGTLSLDQVSPGAGGLAATTVGSGTTPTTLVAEELLWGVWGFATADADASYSIDSSFTKLCGAASASTRNVDGSGATAISGIVGERIVAATAAYSATTTESTSAKGVGLLATFGVTASPLDVPLLRPPTQQTVWRM